jgi:hypothetical protein
MHARAIRLSQARRTGSRLCRHACVRHAPEGFGIHHPTQEERPLGVAGQGVEAGIRTQAIRCHTQHDFISARRCTTPPLLCGRSRQRLTDEHDDPAGGGGAGGVHYSWYGLDIIHHRRAKQRVHHERHAACDEQQVAGRAHGASVAVHATMSAWCLFRPSAAFRCLAPRLLCPVTLHGGASSRALSVARDSVSMRLARRIAAAGVCSRREAEQLIAEGHVTVNGRVVDTPAVNVTLGDAVVVQGAALPVGVLPKQQMWCCHKLEGELVSRRDPKGRPTLFDRLAKMGVPGSSGLIAVVRCRGVSSHSRRCDTTVTNDAQRLATCSRARCAAMRDVHPCMLYAGPTGVQRGRSAAPHELWVAVASAGARALVTGVRRQSGGQGVPRCCSSLLCATSAGRLRVPLLMDTDTLAARCSPGHRQRAGVAEAWCSARRCQVVSVCCCLLLL